MYIFKRSLVYHACVNSTALINSPLTNWVCGFNCPEYRNNRNTFRDRLKVTFGFSYFGFKISLIRLSLSFQKQKFLYSNSRAHWFSVRCHNHYVKESTVSGRHRKALNSFQLCFTDSSWIHLILLIKLIQYNTRKTWLITSSNRILLRD